MVKVLVSKQSNYPVDSANIKRRLSEFFIKNGISSEAEVSVAIVGEKKMLELGKKYLNDTEIHNVLSFESDGKFEYPPDGPIFLGEIVVCFPAVLEEAKKESKLIDEKVYELVEHGALHLLGIHHEE